MARSTLSRPELVHPEQLEALEGERRRDGPLGPHLHEVAHPAQEAVGDPGGASGPRGDVAGPLELHLDAEDPRRAHHDALEVLGRVQVEAAHEAEPVAQRAREQARARGRAHQREPGQVESDRARRRPLADEDVELEVLHGGIEDLFDGAGQPVDLVDEQHVAVLQVGEQRGQVAGADQRRPRGDAQPDAHLRRHDAGQRRLAEAGRPREQQVVDGLVPAPGRLEHDLEVLGELGLAVELVEVPGPQPGLVGELGRVGQGVHGPRRASSGADAGPARRPARGVWTATALRAGRSPGPRQLPQRLAEQLLDRALVCATLEGAADLVGPVAELGQRGAAPRRAPRRDPPAPPGTPSPAKSGSSRRERRSRTRRAAVLRPTPGHGAQRPEVLVEHGPDQVGGAQRARGRPGPGRDRRRARRAAPRSTVAPRRWRTRRARWRPRGHGCARAAPRASPDRPRRPAASATP